MRHAAIIIISLALVLGAVGPALATHNDVGVEYVVGNPDPVPTNEPDVSEALTPIYHAGGSLPSPAGTGTYARAAPDDQSGLGMGEWIGFIDGVIEHPGPAFNQCFHVLVAEGNIRPCEQSSDPLFRVNPDSEECENIENRLDLDECDGEGHSWEYAFWPPVRVQNHALPDLTEAEKDGSGFQYPGLYGYYVYLFGKGSGPAAGEGPFSHLSGDICQQATGLSDCKLITPADIADHTGRTSEDGSAQRAAVCMYRPFFTTLSGGSDDSACPNISEFNQYKEDNDSPFYVNNKPGWYQQTVSIDPYGSTLPYSNVVTKGGNQSDVANIFHYYVNPVRPQSHKWCAGPPIATTAPDELDTGFELQEDGTWLQTQEFDYLVEAHDVDVYTSPTDTSVVFDPANQVLDQVTQLVNDTVPDLPPELQDLLEEAQDTTDNLVDALSRTLEEGQENATGIADPLVSEVNNATERVDPTVGAGAEPNSDRDNSFALTAQSEALQCSSAQGLLTAEDASEPTTYYNYLQNTVGSTAAGTAGGNAGLGGGALHDYTYTDESGLPARSSDQGFNPWSPDLYSFGGSLLVFQDLNHNVAFDGCPPGDDPPTANNPDICAARLPWDVYNEEALRDDDTSMGDFAKDNGFTDPTGLYFTLKVTGPMVVTSSSVGTSTGTQTFADRQRVITDTGQHCIVGISIGLTDGDSDLDDDGETAGERFRALLDLPSSATQDDILDKLCGEVTGETHFLEDAFTDGSTAGVFSSAISWAKLQPTPELTDPDTGDGLELNALITVQEGGDALTSTNIGLGDGGDVTAVETWGDGSVTYKWTDLDLFDSEPAE